LTNANSGGRSHDRRAQIADDDLAFAAHIPDDMAAFIYMHIGAVCGTKKAALLPGASHQSSVARAWHSAVNHLPSKPVTQFL
jgi:hypothetical protein